jgi:hypothetical protein
MISDARAAEMQPLEALILNGSEQTYPLVRCTTLYLSVLEWSGEEALGEDTSKNLKQIISNTGQLATELRTPHQGDLAEPSVIRDVRAISDQYLERYQANYVGSGQAFGNDKMWDADLAICQTLLGAK